MTELEKKYFYKQLGENIRIARRDADMTQITFARLLELSRPSIVNIEKGRQHPPLHFLVDISKILSIDVIDLIPNVQHSQTIEVDQILEAQTDKIINKWISKNPGEHSETTISIVKEFIKDTNPIQDE